MGLATGTASAITQDCRIQIQAIEYAQGRGSYRALRKFISQNRKASWHVRKTVKQATLLWISVNQVSADRVEQLGEDVLILDVVD